MTREPGVCALTAGPGVTNGMSAMASAQANHSPMVVLGGRAPALRWGQGSLQEIDHVPFVRPLTQARRPRREHGGDPGPRRRRLRRRVAPPRRPGLRRLPARLRVHGGGRAGGGRRAAAGSASRHPRSGGDRARAGRRAAAGRRAPGDHGRHRPLLGHGRAGAPELAETLRIPVFLNGLARGLRARRPRAVLLPRALRRR